MLKSMEGAYILERSRRLDRGHLPARRRPEHPDDRHAQAQGREGHHRHGAEGSQAARRVAGLSVPAARVVRVLLFTGKGGVGKTTTAAAATAVRRGRRPADAGAQHRRRALARRRLATTAGRASRRRSRERLYVQQVDAQRRFEQSWGDIQRYLLSVLDTRRRRPDRGRGADRPPRCRGGARAAGGARPGPHRAIGTWSSSTARRPRRRCGCSRCPRPSAGTWSGCCRSSAGWSRLLKPVLTRAAGVPMPRDSVFDAFERLHAELADVRDPVWPRRVGAAGAHAGVGRRRRGASVADLAVAVRLSRRRRRRQPDLPRGGGRRLAQRVGLAARQAILAEVEESFAPLAVWRSAYRAREPVGLDELRAFAPSSTPTPTRSQRHVVRARSRSSGETGRRTFGSCCRSPTGAR